MIAVGFFNVQQFVNDVERLVVLVESTITDDELLLAVHADFFGEARIFLLLDLPLAIGGFQVRR